MESEPGSNAKWNSASGRAVAAPGGVVVLAKHVEGMRLGGLWRSGSNSGRAGMIIPHSPFYDLHEVQMMSRLVTSME